MKNKQESWENLSGSWYQKIFINNESLPIYSYHYGSKLQPASKIIVLETRKAKMLCSYKLIEKDLRDISIMLEECEKIYSVQNPPFLPNQTPRDGILLKGMISAIIAHYFRCFPGGNGRKYKLQEQNISKDNLTTHEFLKQMRNEYIAHADDSIFEECKIVFLVPPEKKVIKGKTAIAMTNTELYQTIGGNDLVSLIKSLVIELRDDVEKRINNISEDIKNELNLIPKDKLYKYMSKSNISRIKLTQKVFEKLIST